MSSATYQLSSGVSILDHGLQDMAASWSHPARQSFVADMIDDGRAYNDADALASSGDYFVALASRLDHLAQGLQRDSAEQIELEHIVHTLFYIQNHYTIIAKSKLRK